jgi:hypothetical protein
MKHHSSKSAVSLCLFGASTLLALSAMAADEPSATTPAPGHVVEADTSATETDIANGQSTHQWLTGQSSGKQASKQPPKLSGPVMTKIHQRYVDSFGKAIPEQLQRTASVK